MDFYSYKLHLYSKENNDLPIEERMYRAKMLAEEKAQQEYDRIKENYSYALAVNPAPGYMGSASAGRMAAFTYQELLLNASNTLAAIQGQSVDEYFDSLIAGETSAIADYAKTKVGSYAETTSRLTRLNKNKGIVSKLTNLFGQGEQVREELADEMGLLSQQYTVGEASCATWESMDDKTKIEYLVGRIEVDGVTTFDEKGIDELGKNLYQMQKESETSFVETMSDITPEE